MFLPSSPFLSFFLPTERLILGSSSYHQNSNRRSARYPDRDRERDREKDRLDRLERERERIHARERDMPMNYDDELNDRHYGGGGMRDEFAIHRDERRPIDRDPRNRDPRVERDRGHVDLSSNSRHLVNSSNYDDSVDLIREKEKERFAHRRDREADYSPHRGNRRVLNANAM
jgi:hypothetical protein